jgi:serine/threonine protein kinase
MLLNEYQIESSQTGYFSRILKVKKLETQDYFIIKMMEKNNNKYSKELKNEISIIKEINHPNIAKLIDIKEDDK